MRAMLEKETVELGNTKYNAVKWKKSKNKFLRNSIEMRYSHPNLGRNVKLIIGIVNLRCDEE